MTEQTIRLNQYMFDVAIRSQIFMKRNVRGLLMFLYNETGEVNKENKMALFELFGRRMVEKEMRRIISLRRLKLMEVARVTLENASTIIEMELKNEQEALEFITQKSKPVHKVAAFSLETLILGNTFKELIYQYLDKDSIRLVAHIRTHNTEDPGGFLSGMEKIFETTQKDMELLIHTGMTGLREAEKAAFYESTGARAFRWTSVLDTRTSSACRERDGKMIPAKGHQLLLGEERLDNIRERPPLHPNCRSTLTPIYPNEGELPKNITFDKWLDTQPLEVLSEIVGRDNAISLTSSKKLPNGAKLQDFLDIPNQPSILNPEQLKRLMQIPPRSILG